MKRPGKVEFKHKIKEYGGNLSAVARSCSVTRQTVYQWRDHYQLGDYIRDCRADMQELATDVIYDQLFDDDPDIAFRAAAFVKTRLGENGMTMFPPDVLVILSGLGMSPQSAVDQFVQLLRAEHARRKS